MGEERKLGRAGVVSSLLRIADAVTRQEIDGVATVKRLRLLADRIEQGRPAPAPKTADAAPAPPVLAIFTFWQRQLGHPQAQLTPGRRKVIEARLREYPAETLRRAIIGCSMSGHHMGKNDDKTRYDDLTLILRSGEKVEWFADKAGGASVSTGADISGASDEQMAEIERLQDAAMEALSDGRQAEYERLEARLAQLRAEAGRADAPRGGHAAQQPLDGGDRGDD